MKEIEEEMENQEQDGEFFGTSISNVKMFVFSKGFMHKKVSATLVERRLLELQRPAKQWAIFIIHAASYAVPVVGLYGAKPSIMSMEKSTVKKTIWCVF